jgi:hypothetical protein
MYSPFDTLMLSLNPVMIVMTSEYIARFAYSLRLFHIFFAYRVSLWAAFPYFSLRFSHLPFGLIMVMRRLSRAQTLGVFIAQVVFHFCY